jgi:hypothetical protein
MIHPYILCLCTLGHMAAAPDPDAFVLEAAAPDGRVVIGRGHSDLAGNKHGFEGGCAFRHQGEYHLFTAEMHGEPFWAAMRSGHWKSADLETWERVGTIFESKGAGFEEDMKYSIWSPMPVFNESEDRWNLFYVCYQGDADCGGVRHMRGKIYRAESKTAGRGGLGGPYEDADVLMRPDAESMAWEGQQGVASFYPYRVGDRWYSHYCSHNFDPISYWRCGLASAPALRGPWKRMPEHSPMDYEKKFVENPVISRIGPYHAAVYDSAVIGENREYMPDTKYIGYSFSLDGIHWAPGKRLAIHTDSEANWTADIRTPLGLIPMDNGEYALLYTARDKNAFFWNIGLTRVRAVCREPAAGK